MFDLRDKEGSVTAKRRVAGDKVTGPIPRVQRDPHTDMVTQNGTTVGNVPGVDGKLMRLADGGIVGVTGYFGQDVIFAEWMDAGAIYEHRPQFQPDTNFAALVGYADRCIVYASTLMLPQWTDMAFTALGSGFEIALGAMAFGASARQAVELAAQFDVYTGGKITEIQCSVPCADAHPRPDRREGHRE